MQPPGSEEVVKGMRNRRVKRVAGEVHCRMSVEESEWVACSRNANVVEILRTGEIGSVNCVALHVHVQHRYSERVRRCDYEPASSKDARTVKNS
jgi:hypothetical protein